MEANLSQQNEKILLKITELEKSLSEVIKGLKNEQNVKLEELRINKLSKENVSKLLIEMAEKLSK